MHFSFESIALALSQKSSMEDALKSTAKTVSAPSAERQTPIDKSEPNPMSTQCSSEFLPDQCTTQNYLTFNTFSIFVLLLIITLILLNVYLLVQLYTLKHKQTNSIHIDSKLLDQLSG